MTQQNTQTVTTVTLAGKQYQLEPVNAEHRAEFEKWLQQRVIKMGIDATTDNMPQRERDEIMDAAFRRANRTGLDTPEGQAVANTLDGVSRLLWLGLRRNHPELTPEAVEALLADEATRVADVQAAVSAEARPGKQRSKRKAQPRKSRSR